MDLRVGLKESWVPKNWCFWAAVLEKTLESHLDCKEIKPVHPKGNQCWIFIGRTDFEAETPTLATWCKELTHLKRSWCWERVRGGGEGVERGYDGSMASPIQWTWVSVDSWIWRWTRRPSLLWFMESQIFGHDWVTELKWCCDMDIEMIQQWYTATLIRDIRNNLSKIPCLQSQGLDWLNDRRSSIY